MPDAANTSPAILSCNACGTLNRLDLQRVGERAKCARCGELLHPDVPMQLTDTNFDRVIGGTSVPVLVDFHADWCGPCRIVAPVVAEFARARAGSVLVLKVDTDRNPELSERLGIRGIPTLIVFRNGRETGRHVGLATRPQLEALVSRP